MDLLIKAEESKMIQIINYPKQKYNSLINMKTNYLLMLDSLEQARIEQQQKGSSLTIESLDQIDSIQQKLTNLKHSGNEFRQLIQGKNIDNINNNNDINNKVGGSSSSSEPIIVHLEQLALEFNQ